MAAVPAAPAAAAEGEGGDALDAYMSSVSHTIDESKASPGSVAFTCGRCQEGPMPFRGGLTGAPAGMARSGR